MKCDLCNREKNHQSLPCAPCAEVIARLVGIRQRLEAPETCVAARLAGKGKAAAARVTGS